MDGKFQLILKSLICVGLTVSTSVVSLTKDSKELSANAQTGVGEAIAIAKLATEIIDWFNSPDNPVSVAFHLGANQCGNVARYTRTVAALRRVEQEESAESVLDLNRFINASELKKIVLILSWLETSMLSMQA